MDDKSTPRQNKGKGKAPEDICLESHWRVVLRSSQPQGAIVLEQQRKRTLSVAGPQGSRPVAGHAPEHIAEQEARFAAFLDSDSVSVPTTSLAPPAPRPPSIPRDPQSSGGTGPFTFPDCVTSCIGDTGCGLNDAHCMCRSAAAPGGILEAVLSCMSFHCRAELHNADANLLAPIQIGCNALNRPIPQAAVQQAEAFANALRQGNAVAGGAGGGGGVSAGAATSTAKSISYHNERGATDKVLWNWLVEVFFDWWTGV
ncbi:hypothetical protein P8C59_007909 [Phyllachora maydis]|uniref:Extracellular membrane protein CFEM domain-containing protein n=1 Tax=Phyllachora maydis TaxID=1825666 RepID=A0AAD9IB66_9PEZI|nr:hypothetical protein P8C59_007909 [Phyllachora maydis]